MTPLEAPFPWFGGKSRVAPLVWERFGRVDNYVEPFFGSGAVLLGAPRIHGAETVNDKDGFVANFWRAVSRDAQAVAEYVDYPVNENDLHARHAWLAAQRPALTARLEGDPDYYDAKIAGWWCWGLCSWIAGGWCSGQGPWHVAEGLLRNTGEPGGTSRQRPHLGNQGQGVHRQLPHLGDQGRGVHRKRRIHEWFAALQERLRRVRVCSGDWLRVLGPSPTTKLGMTAVFLDPPYSAEADRSEVYSTEDLAVAHKVREWCLAHGDDPLLRIALCGYEGEHDLPGWECVAWKAHGGYGNWSDKRGRVNATRERIWFSPGCYT